MNYDERSYKSVFTIIGHILTVLSIIGYTIMLFATHFATPFILTLIISIILDIFIISAFYGLGYALTKINRLEDLLLDKQIINQQDVEGIDGASDEIINTEEIVYCNYCGNQIFAEEEKCSNCGKPKQ